MGRPVQDTFFISSFSSFLQVYGSTYSSRFKLHWTEKLWCRVSWRTRHVLIYALCRVDTGAAIIRIAGSINKRYRYLWRVVIYVVSCFCGCYKSESAGSTNGSAYDCKESRKDKERVHSNKLRALIIFEIFTVAAFSYRIIDHWNQIFRGRTKILFRLFSNPLLNLNFGWNTHFFLFKLNTAISNTWMRFLKNGWYIFVSDQKFS